MVYPFKILNTYCSFFIFLRLRSQFALNQQKVKLHYSVCAGQITELENKLTAAKATCQASEAQKKALKQTYDQKILELQNSKKLLGKLTQVTWILNSITSISH